MVWMVWACATALVAALWFGFRVTNRHVLRLCKALPCAQPYYPVIGNALMVTCSLQKMTDNLEKMLEESIVRRERAVCIWVGCYPLIFIVDPDDIKKILNNSLGRGKEMEESVKAYTEYGLIVSPVDHWKVTRRHLNPLFHPRNLEQLVPTFDRVSADLVDEMATRIGGAPFDLLPHVMTAALKSICIFLYGENITDNATPEQFEDLKHAVEKAAELMALRLTRPWLNSAIIFQLFYGKEYNEGIRTLSTILEIAKKATLKSGRLHEKKNYIDDSVKQSEDQNGFQSIFDAMYDLKQNVPSIKDQHIKDEITNFFGTGTDTIGVAVSSCLLALSQYQHIQDKVYAEICSVLTDDDCREITESNLKQLNYLDQVVKETLRLFGVVPSTCRSPTKDIDLGGYTIPANKTAFLYLKAANMDPRRFPEPRRFDPDRFSADKDSGDRGFMPFSRGPRNCIGKTYSMMLVKVMVAHVVRAYRLSTDMNIDNIKWKYMITMTSFDGYNVHLSKRRSQKTA